jgi:hypothetical protein
MAKTKKRQDIFVYYDYLKTYYDAIAKELRDIEDRLRFHISKEIIPYPLQTIRPLRGGEYNVSLVTESALEFTAARMRDNRITKDQWGLVATMYDDIPKLNVHDKSTPTNEGVKYIYSKDEWADWYREIVEGTEALGIHVGFMYMRKMPSPRVAAGLAVIYTGKYLLDEI